MLCWLYFSAFALCAHDCLGNRSEDERYCIGFAAMFKPHDSCRRRRPLAQMRSGRFLPLWPGVGAAGVGELVGVNDMPIGFAGEQANAGGAYEAGAAGDQKRCVVGCGHGLVMGRSTVRCEWSLLSFRPSEASGEISCSVAPPRKISPFRSQAPSSRDDRRSLSFQLKRRSLFWLGALVREIPRLRSE